MKSDDEEDKASDEKGSDSDGSQDSGFGFDKKKVKGKKPPAPTKRFNKKAPKPLRRVVRRARQLRRARQQPRQSLLRRRLT